MNFALQEVEHLLEPLSRASWSDHGESYTRTVAAAHGAGTSRVFILDMKAEIAGFITCRIEVSTNPILSETVRRHLYIQDIYLEPHLRGLGIGQGLIQAAIAHGRANGVSHALIGALHRNERARSAYRNAGFEDYEVRLIRTL